MIDHDEWDEYYDGGFAKDKSADDFWEAYDLQPPNAVLGYWGQKSNVTAKQIMQDTQTKKINDKFLYDKNEVVILLDYSKGIFDRWKNGRILYCLGEGIYSNKGDIDHLSAVDKVLFHTDTPEKGKIRAFWKDESKKYRFANGLLVLCKEPYQIEEDGKYRWVFPLSLMSEYNFRMPEKYSFHVDPKRIKRSEINEANIDDEVNLMQFNDQAVFNSDRSEITYKRIPQKKDIHISKQEKIERRRKTAENALILAGFKCEIDNDHFTFIRKKQNVPYTEAHHLVPLAYSDLFEFSLDVEENIVSLCSTCHNQIHYGTDAEQLIRKLYQSRKELLEGAGIVLSEEELLEMYGIC